MNYVCGNCYGNVMSYRGGGIGYANTWIHWYADGRAGHIYCVTEKSSIVYSNKCAVPIPSGRLYVRETDEV